MIEIPEWVSLEGPAAKVYYAAVSEGCLMDMRRAAFLTPDLDDSPKLKRLQKIVEESANDGFKVLIFSFFRPIIEIIHNNLGSLSLGMITGSTLPDERQRLVRQISSHRGPAVLVGQIKAMGNGLNIQAASVVIMAEPQWNPSDERQPIARCRRPGLERLGKVHWLLARGSVDEYILRVSARKARISNDFAGSIAERDFAIELPNDICDRLADEKTSEREKERLIIEMERKRLGIEAEDSAICHK